VFRNLLTVVVLAGLALLWTTSAFAQPNPLRGPDRNLNTVSPPATSEQAIYQPALVIARVGDQPIFLGDLLGPVNQMLEPYVKKYPKEVLDAQRQKMIRQLLKVQVETKMFYLEFLNKFPNPEAIPEVINSVHDQFNREQLDNFVEAAGLNNAAEFDAYLRQYGSSLQKTRRNFTEQALGQQQLRQEIKFDAEITHQQMLDYYKEHIKDYETPAEVRWEQIMVQFSKFPNKDAAYNEIHSMFNQVYFGGRSMAAVAKERSHGLNADQGGFYDWTRKGSLASRVVEEAIFRNPAGRLSPILESKNGFHVVQVRERRNANRIAFKAPDHIIVVRQFVRETGTDLEIQGVLENTSSQDTIVELALYYFDANKKMRFRERTTVLVPRLGTASAIFKLSDPGLKSLPNENLKLSIEPQIRIKQLIQNERIKKQREAYTAKLRAIYKPWTIFDQDDAGKNVTESPQPRDERDARRPYVPRGGSFRPQ